MVFSRAPSIMTEKLRRIINRDTIISISIIGPLAAFLDSVTEPTLSSTDKTIAYVLMVLFVGIGLIRLIRGSILDRKPIYTIILYIAILMPTTSYFTDVRSFYIFFWIIPVYLASFYYGKKYAYLIFVALAVTQIAKIVIFTHYDYITSAEDYLYMISEFFIVLSLCLLVMDTTSVSEEDRSILFNSLEKTELEQQRLSAVMNSIDVGVVSVDESFQVVSFNAAALDILDMHDNILGKDLRQICYVEGLDGKPFNISSLIDDNNSDKEVRITYTDGQVATLSAAAVPIRLKATKENEGSVFLLRDITKQKSLEEERSAFVSLMSHELRTPLAIAEANASNAELVFKKGETDKAEEAISNVGQEIKKLTKIINEFSLVIGTIQQNSDIIKESVNLDSVCRKLLEDYSPEAEKNGVVFVAQIAPNTKVEIYTNPEYFINIIKSLTDNSIKFTQQGSVTVRFSEENRSLIATVEDTGAGIPKSDQAKVFSAYYQSDDYTTRSYGGLGVGLYTAKKLAEMLGGNLSFTSEKDHGSIFKLTIPTKLLSAPEPPTDKLPQS
ncbi:PAS domain-containing sensor histidine kinase [Candidatus Saccharibacteria bacterium]|nr:PAS domain-containing sensor histidine kinase [Candidatus Saccharibacteria bacterium]